MLAFVEVEEYDTLLVGVNAPQLYTGNVIPRYRSKAQEDAEMTDDISDGVRSEIAQSLSHSEGSTDDDMEVDPKPKPKKRVNVDPTEYRYVDFTIIQRSGKKASIVAIVEVKPHPWETEEGALPTILEPQSEKDLIYAHRRGMMPQVVLQAQFVFHEQPDATEVWALCVVGSYCTFCRFERDRTPPLREGRAHRDGYRPIKSQGQPKPRDVPAWTSDTLPILADDRRDYSEGFKDRWQGFMEWVGQTD
ncbi:hypothetical protein BV25DRAFT_1833359 [Artomyces pyxidatus]|uniref:Uncharacterized protein n=1 Tax=Artomyces pyxidatus TaxID=48021 RepID=A0ACB8SG46_9AGAM|nr:hypothetical protein BV25DRAFT_1833359 [Artomyces pyxidatus]